jgi:hypothetical protein
METVDQTMTLMLLAQSEGMHPATAARDFHIIKGRPSMKADAMLARFQQSGGKVTWQEYTDARVAATFEHPQSPKAVLIEWTFAQATKIGLTGKDNWKHYPRAMLRARVISEGVRTCYPVISTGVYTPEEVADFTPSEKDVTPGNTGLLGDLTGKRQEIVIQTASQIREALRDDRVMDAYGLSESLADPEEKKAMWSMLDSDMRSLIKRVGDVERAATDGVISESQKRRLEARIQELKIDREAVKEVCRDRYSVEHFKELTGPQYDQLDALLPTLAPGANTAAEELL